VVYHDAYEYGDVKDGKDYIMQTDPAGQPASS
jgi:hypothetical protein